MLRLTFLGTSGAMPTAGRNLSGLSVRQGREHYLVDCGEGTYSTEPLPPAARQPPPPPALQAPAK